MDAQTIKSTWHEVCEKIKGYDNIDVSQINAFFSRLHPQVMSDGFILITADNEFIKTWIEKHYISYIKQALFDIYKRPYTVVIEEDVNKDEPSISLGIDSYEQDCKNELPTTNTKHQNTPIGNLDKISDPPQQKSVENVFEELPELVLEDDSQDSKTPTSNLTFENFVIGDSNRMAYLMAVSVAEMPGKANLNPLFIYGKSGLGKTHLLRATQNYISETMPEMKTIYVDSAELLSDYMEASAAHDKEKSSYKNFKNKYEEADVLLIDDVQYLQGKKQTLDIVFQIFNKLTNQGKQVILSADRAPKNIDIDERYKSRFNSGGTFEIQPPEIETKLGIIFSFVEEYRQSEGDYSFLIPDEISVYIAENSSSNIRELKSAVTKVIYQMTFFNQPDLDVDDVRRLLENHFSGGSSKKLNPTEIQKVVENFYKVSHADLVGSKRSRNIVYARQVAIYLCRQMLDLTYSNIGKTFNRDHTTILYSVITVEEKLKENRELREEIEALKQLIRDL